jgi:hypothetical protein
LTSSLKLSREEGKAGVGVTVGVGVGVGVIVGVIVEVTEGTVNVGVAVSVTVAVGVRVSVTHPAKTIRTTNTTKNFFIFIPCLVKNRNVIIII